MRENALKPLKAFLQKMPFYFGWELSSIGASPYYPYGGIQVVFRNVSTGGRLEITISERDDDIPSYGRTRSFNICIMGKEAASRPEPEEAAAVSYFVQILKEFDTGNFKLPKNRYGTRIQENRECSASGEMLGSATIILTSQCAWKCCFCPVGRRNQDAFHTDEKGLLEEIKKYVEVWKDREISNLSISGNEPLHHIEFTQILNECSRHFDPVVVQTTGTKLLEADFAGRIERPEKVIFELPLYGYSATVHDTITGVHGSFSNIAALAENSFWNIRLHTILLKQNVDTAAKAKEFSLQKGRKHKFLILYLSSDQESYIENAPRLRHTVETIKAISSDEEFLAFTTLNRNKIPPCVSSVRYNIENATHSIMTADGASLKVPAWGEKNETMAVCPNRKKCAAGRDCPGVYDVYAERYGWDEFKPI